MQREISAILGKGKVILRETERSVTPYGGVMVLAEYLKKIGETRQRITTADSGAEKARTSGVNSNLIVQNQER